MASDLLSDKLSIKNLLFSKAIPNYEIPVPVNGRKVFACTDCGDKFLFESSYHHHVNRQSVKISYMCRHCDQRKIFYNRCKLLLHIRSHAFKTTSINVYDLNVEPLPLSMYAKIPLTPNKQTSQMAQPSNSRKQSGSGTVCYECQEVISEGYPIPAYKEREHHFMRYTNEVHSCPVCLFALPTICGLKAHMRLHLKQPPYYCPECGIHLPNKNICYPYNHDCEGFNMMRATARLKCPIPECNLFHPNDYKEHMKEKHCKKVLKCPLCVVACFNEVTMKKHLLTHRTTSTAVVFFQCFLCPGRLVLQNHLDNHILTHINNTHSYPCWHCGMVFKDVNGLIIHFSKNHAHTSELKSLYSDIYPKNTEINNDQTVTGTKIYRVVKRCEQCKRSFTYKCKYDEIHVLPIICPYKCSKNATKSLIPEKAPINKKSVIMCHMCDTEVSDNWQDIKNHYATHHKTHKCLDIRVVLPKIDIKKYLIYKENYKKITKSSNKKSKISKAKRRSLGVKNISPTSNMQNIAQLSNTNTESFENYACSKCNISFNTKELLQTHMISHRDPCMAYQCLECGQSFVVKPSFSKHLIIEHGITDVELYIKEKQCYNQDALMKRQFEEAVEEPLLENQCRICRDQFDSTEDLQKHFRVHGMAFLMNNTPSKNDT